MNILPPTANARWPGVKPGRTIQGMSAAIGEGVMALDCRWWFSACWQLWLWDLKPEYLGPFFSSNSYRIRSMYIHMDSPCHHGETAEEELFELLTCHRSDSWHFHVWFHVTCVFGFGVRFLHTTIPLSFFDQKINDWRKGMVHSHGNVCHRPVCQLPVMASLKVISGSWLAPAQTKT